MTRKHIFGEYTDFRLGLKAVTEATEITEIMGQYRIYGKVREITIFRYRDSAPLP